MKNYRSTKAACYAGLVVQAIVNNFLPILFIVFQNNYHLSYEKLGRIIFINFFTQIFADFSTPKIIDRLGYKSGAIVCQSLAAFGLILLSVLTRIMADTYSAIIISVVFYAFGSGIMEVVLSPIIELLPSDNKAAGMAILHSFYCWGQAFTIIGTTVLLKFIGSDSWNLIPLIWAVIPIMNAVAFSKVPIIEPQKREEKSYAKEMFFTREFFCFIIFMVCAGASEISMSQWASVFVQKGLGVSKVVGDLLGPCAFAVCMGTGRIVYGAFAGRYSSRKALIFNNLLCVCCYLLVGICHNPVLSLIGCALCGFSVSLSWPGTYSLAAARFPLGGTLMFSIFALCGDLGCSAGPWILGATADVYGLNTGFIVCSVFPALMLLTALFVFKEKDCKPA